jgi:hypothetical protein
MRRRSAWKIENYTYRECPHPDREFGYAVSLHNHSCHSVEKLAALNQVIKLAFMRPLSGVLKRSFGLGGVSDLNYAEITSNPPTLPKMCIRWRQQRRRIGGSTGFTWPSPITTNLPAASLCCAAGPI